MPTDFLIVGGGIGGLVLAELLGRGGKRVVVLERSTGPPLWNRPEILWPATIELLSALLPASQWLEQAAVPLAGVKVASGSHFVWGISPELLKRASVHPWSTNPNQSRELLMKLGSFELHRGVQVESIIKEQGRIVGARTRDLAGGDAAGGREREWLAETTVGDDGAHSLVRAACGIELATRVFPRDLLCFQCDWPAPLQADAGHIWPNRARPQSGILAIGILPVPGQRGVGVAPIRPDLASDDPRAQEAWQALIQSEPVLASLLVNRSFPGDFQRVRRPWGHAARYRARGPDHGRCGSSRQPGWRAGCQHVDCRRPHHRRVSARGCERNLLGAYERIRRSANRRSLRFTRGAAFVFGLPGWLLPMPLLFWLVGKFGSRPWLVSRFVQAASTAFVAR